MHPTVISPVLVPVLLVLCLIGTSNGSNILCLFTSPGRSHLIIDMAIARPLIDKGHNVTIVTTMAIKDKNPKYNHIFLPPADEDYAKYQQILSTAAGQSSSFDSYKDIFWANVERVRIQDKAINNLRFKELLENPGNKFDAVIIGWVFNTYQIGIAAHFKCPVILSFINHPTSLVLSFSGSPSSLATVPSMFPYDLMCFKNRLKNMFFALIWLALEEFSEYKMAQYYDEYFFSERYPSYDEMKKNISLVFCASHFVDGRIRALTPGFIEIGGIQVKEKPDPLPKDIEDFINTPDDGFIFFSLGTNIKTADISPNATLAIFKVFSQSKYKILWKWDDIDPPGKSPNIMFRKWFPQDDLLANSKLKLFITHAGKGSTVEATYHGVPMIALPIYGDQFGNAREITEMGYGLTVNHWNATEESFRKDFYEVLEKPKYLKAVTKFSQRYRDRPLSPRESVVFWTEYVIRHRGAKHMQSPVIHLNFFQKNSLDVLAVLVVVLYISFVIVRKIFRLSCLLIFRKKLKSD